MSANDEYFAMLARLMVQSAEAKRNKEQDEEDRIFRRQQAADALALQRENLALEGRRTDASVRLNEAQMRAAERGDLRDEEKYRREVDRQEQDDAEIEAAATLADNPDAMLGVKPLSESVGGKVKLRALGMRANKAKTEDEIAAAAEAPMEREQGRKLKASQIAAAEEQTAAYKQQREDALLRRDHEARMRDLLEIESRQRTEANAVDLGTKRREAEQSMRDMVARRLGLRTDAEQAGAREFFDKMRIQGLFEAANRAATTSLDGTTFNNDIYTTQVAKIQNAMELAGNLGALSKRDPTKFKELKAEAADVMMKILESGGSPSVALDSVGKLVGSVVKATKPPPPPSDVVPKTALGRSIKANEAASAATRVGKASEIMKILDSDTSVTRKIVKAVSDLKLNIDAEGNAHPVTDDMVVEAILDYLPKDATPTKKNVEFFIEYAKYQSMSKGNLTRKPWPVVGSPKD